VSFWTGRVNSTSTTPTTGTADSNGVITSPDAPIVKAPTPPATLVQGVPLEDETRMVTPTLAGIRTWSALVKGQRYRIEVRGTWRWNKVSGSVADAECSDTATSGWQSSRWLARAAGDQLGLYLDGRDLDLHSYSGSACASGSHTYVTYVTATRTGRVPLKLWEPAPTTKYLDNSGGLRVRIIHDTPRDVLPVKLDVRDQRGTTTPGSVVAGEQYTVTAIGTWSPGGGQRADAVCVETENGQVQPRDSDGHRLWRVRLDGQSLRADCSPDHSYSWTFTAQSSGPVVALLDDESFGDNSGAVYLKLTKVVPV
jgi:hypothetical protein